MGNLVFSLSSEEAARMADSELTRNGVKRQQIRMFDPRSSASAAALGADPTMMGEFDREAAEGRVLLEVVVDEQNFAAVERLVAMLGGDARKFVVEHVTAQDRVESVLED